MVFWSLSNRRVVELLRQLDGEDVIQADVEERLLIAQQILDSRKYCDGCDGFCSVASDSGRDLNDRFWRSVVRGLSPTCQTGHNAMICVGSFSSNFYWSYAPHTRDE